MAVPSVRALGAVLSMLLRPSITSASLRLAHQIQSPSVSNSGRKCSLAAARKCFGPKTCT